ncbi:Hydrogen cyanide synthase subunit HcnC [Bienertia sinuspersici]
MNQSTSQGIFRQPTNGSNSTRNLARWSICEDRALVSTMNDLVDLVGWKTDNGQFKNGAYAKLETLMNKNYLIVKKKAKPHIESRVKLLRKQYDAISEMLSPSASGFGWNDDGKFVTCPQSVWDEWIKVMLETYILMLIILVSVKAKNALEMYHLLGPPPSTTRSTKTKRARTETIEALKEFSTKLAKISDVMEGASEHIGRLANCFQHVSNSAERRMKVTGEIMKMEGLTPNEVIMVSKKIALNPLEVDFLFSLPEDYKFAYVQGFFDVVVVGAGIIGLSIARDLLHRSNLSVAVVDAAVPCSGATGAGQGYLWMINKTPGTDVWDLAIRSQKLWHLLADNLQDQGSDPLEKLGWKNTGSLLIGRTEPEQDQLQNRVQQLAAAGVRAEYLSNNDLATREPELGITQGSGAAFLPDDSQLDAHRTVAFIEKVCAVISIDPGQELLIIATSFKNLWITGSLYPKEDMQSSIMNQPYVSSGLLQIAIVPCSSPKLRTSDKKEKIEGIKTQRNTLYGRKAIIIASGCWTGSVMDKLLQDSDIALHVPIRPRKGFLLSLENFNCLKLRHGLMEAGYVDHQKSVISASEESDHDETLSVSMTATTDACGNLLIGSSRQFAGFNTELNTFIVSRIWERAQEFFPALKKISIKDLNEQMNVRIGLRPYSKLPFNIQDGYIMRSSLTILNCKLCLMVSQLLGQYLVYPISSLLVGMKEEDFAWYYIIIILQPHLSAPFVLKENVFLENDFPSSFHFPLFC